VHSSDFLPAVMHHNYLLTYSWLASCKHYSTTVLACSFLTTIAVDDLELTVVIAFHTDCLIMSPQIRTASFCVWF